MTPRDDYERDGFLVLPRFVEPAACDALIARANDPRARYHPDNWLSRGPDLPLRGFDADSIA